MTEEEWRTSSDAVSMLNKVLKRKSDPRRLRLYAIATCRRFWKQLPGAPTRKLVEKVEAFVEGKASWDEVAVQRETAASKLRAKPLTAIPNVESIYDLPPMKFWQLAFDASSRSITDVPMAYLGLARLKHDLRGQPDPEQADITRCVFSGVILKPKFRPAWLSSDVVALASAIYDERAFDRMPILADALEEAECDHADVLAHCRGPGLHVRGCWVVDLLLGKS